MRGANHYPHGAANTLDTGQQTEVIWRIELLGGVSLSRGGEQRPPFKTRRMTRLLARLACFPDRAHARDILAEELWPEEDPEAIRERFRQTLALLRRELEPADVSAGSVLIADRSTVRLAPRSFTTDIADFTAALRMAATETDLVRQIAPLRQAVTLYRGDLMPGFDEDWIQTERLHLAERSRQALVRLTMLLASGGQWEEAIETARRTITADPLHEEAHCMLIRLFAQSGRMADAHRQYEALERLLKEQMNLEPAAATQDLMRELRSGLTLASLLSVSPQPPVVVAPLEPTLPAQTVAPPTAVLPHPMTRFYGREAEIEQLTALLSPQGVPSNAPPPLVTLTGQGGAGKTRLALEVARRLAPSYAQAVWFVPLADVLSPERIGDAVCETLELARSGQSDPIQQAIAFLRGYPNALLIFDNFEHLQEEGTPVLQALRHRLPHLACLVTSRHKLNLDGERDLTLSPLATPEGEQSSEQLQSYPSVQLFLDRAQAARYSFALTPANADAIATLVQQLEGLPLAIELAAAWAATLTPEQILLRLSHRFELLVSRRRDAPQRHRSLQAVLEGSVQLLPPWLQKLYAQLSVFRGGWTLEAVEQVARVPTTTSVGTLHYMEGLALLQERSFVHSEEADAEMRYSLLESLRKFGAEQLTAEEQRSLAQRHAAFYLVLATEAQAHLRTPAEKQWFDRLELENENLRAALGWALANEPDTALQMTARLPHFWMTRGFAREGSDWLHRALRCPAEVSTVRAEALNGLALMKFSLSEYDAGKAWALESLKARRELEDPQGTAKTLNTLGAILMEQGDYREAQTCYEECLGLHRLTGHRMGESIVLANLGNLVYGQGEYAMACNYYEACLEARRALGDRRGIAAALDYMARAVREQGDYGRACDLHAESLDMRRELNDKQSVALSLNHMAFAKILMGEKVVARTLLEESLVYSREIGDKAGVAEAFSLLGELARQDNAGTSPRGYWSESLTIWQEMGDRASTVALLESFAGLVHSEGQSDAAAQLLGFAEALRTEIFSPLRPSSLPRYAQTLDAVRAALGSEAFEAAWTVGRSLTLEQAIRLVL